MTDVGFRAGYQSTFFSKPFKGGERVTYITDFLLRGDLTEEHAIHESLNGLNHETLHFVLTDIDETRGEGLDGPVPLNIDIEIAMGWSEPIANYSCPLL